MKNKINISILIGFFALLTSGCAIKWTEAIHHGNAVHTEFRDSVAIEIHKNLIIVPITIRGNNYRFLFDTGAPFSISNELQRDHIFKIISKGNIVDSDQNRKKVNWVKVDSIGIGNAIFVKQTAFVGDFEAHPILRCLGIDGIIGSNLIRHSNWKIDQQNNSLSLSKIFKRDFSKDYIMIPFKTDYQYNIFIDLNIGQAKTKNMLVDYGSNGSIALNNAIFSSLKDENVIGETFLEKGIKQSGIIGKPVDLFREITYTDAVRMDNLQLKNVKIQTGSTVSIGNELLSRFQVTVDWNHKKLYLIKFEETKERLGFAGFSLGYSTEKGIYVQSVIEQSDAYNKGIRTNMKVVKLDHLDFESSHDYCDYINHEIGGSIYLQLIDSTDKKIEYLIQRTTLINNY
jgi:hypothetical protein